MLEYIIIFLSVLVYLLYLKTKNYDSVIGIIMFILAFSTLFLKTSYLPSSLFYVKSTFWLSAVIVGITTIVFTILSSITKSGIIFPYVIIIMKKILCKTKKRTYPPVNRLDGITVLRINTQSTFFVLC